jgi:hypothetical protein
MTYMWGRGLIFVASAPCEIKSDERVRSLLQLMIALGYNVALLSRGMQGYYCRQCSSRMIRRCLLCKIFWMWGWGPEWTNWWHLVFGAFNNGSQHLVEGWHLMYDSWYLFVFNLQQGVENHGTTLIKIHRICWKVWLLLLLWVPTINLEIPLGNRKFSNGSTKPSVRT